MKGKDYILIIIVLFVALILYLFLGGRSMGNQVRIELDGQEYGTYSLAVEQEIRVESKYGINVVQIEDGIVYMKEADCPDHYCMKQGKTNSKGKSLVCLPHKLVVSVTGDFQESDEGELDAISQ